MPARLAAFWIAVKRELIALPATIRASSRSLRRAPGFVAIATLSLGAALGLSTSVFAFIDSMRHPESPFRAVDQLYMVMPLVGGPYAPPRQEVSAAIAHLRGVLAEASMRIEYDDVEFKDGVDRLGVVFIGRGFFDIAGIKPRIGRLPSDADLGGRGVAVVSDDVWRSRFNNRDHLDGAEIAIGDDEYTVIGVLPPRTSVRFFNGRDQVWIPDPTPGATAIGLSLIRVAGGSADTVSVQHQLNALMKRWTNEYLTPRDRPFSGRLYSLRPDPLALEGYHIAMIGAAICVLLIACANVAALMLARGMVRTRDYAVRLALGANRIEVAREVIVEVIILAVASCVAGALAATATVGLLSGAMPAELHLTGFSHPQWSVRVFALSGLAVVTSIAIAGGFPAWQASRTDPMGPLKENSGGTIGRAGTRFRWLVMAELALAMTLVMGSSLMLKSVVRMSDYDFGYNARRLVAADAYVPRYFIRGNQFVLNPDTLTGDENIKLAAHVLAALNAIPGVQHAARMTGCGLHANAATTDRTVEGGVPAYVSHCNVGSTGLFAALGIPIADGRDFADGDDIAGAIIINERTARKLFPHERAVGRLLKLGDSKSSVPFLPIVGVVRDRDLGFNPFPEAGPDTSMQVYAVRPQDRGNLGDLVILPAHGAKGIDLAVWKTLRTAMPPHSTISVLPFAKSYFDALTVERFLTVLFMLLGAISLALGAAGLFSVISYVAGQRNREFAVRIALGAPRENILRLVLTEGFLMALGGTAVGAGLGMWAGFLLWDKMWGVYPVDAQSLIGGEIVLIAVTMVACLLPALRATKANPVDVLRAA